MFTNNAHQKENLARWNPSKTHEEASDKNLFRVNWKQLSTSLVELEKQLECKYPHVAEDSPSYWLPNLLTTNKFESDLKDEIMPIGKRDFQNMGVCISHLRKIELNWSVRRPAWLAETT